MNTVAKSRIALSRARENRKDIYVPLLHLASRDVNTIGLTSTAHGEVDIQSGKVVAGVALGNSIERRRVVENVVVEGEIAAICASA